MTDPTLPNPSARSKAIAEGSPKYFTGKPCRNGHVVDRYTIDGYCVTCRSEKQRLERVKIMERRTP